MENLIELKEELSWISEQAKEIFDRENHPDGNKMLKNQNFGKYVAYSHCLRRLNELESGGQKQPDSTEAFNLHGVMDAVCPKCNKHMNHFEMHAKKCFKCNADGQTEP